MAFGKVTIYVDDRPAERGRKQAEAKWKAWGRSITRGFSGAVGKVGGFAARAFDPLGAGLSVVGDVVGDIMDYERGVARMGIAQGKSNEEMAGFRAQLNAISAATGVARNDVLRGAQAYQSLTGDTEHAAEVAATLAKVARASGTDIAEIAATADSLRSFGADPSSLEAYFDILLTQGKAGKIELSELAAILPDVAGQFGQFAGGKTQGGMAEMNAGLQVMREKFGSAEKAATGFNAYQSAIISKAGKFKRAGIDFYDSKGKLKGYSAILGEITEKSKTMSETEMSGLFGSTEAYRGFLALKEGSALFENLKDTSGAAGAATRDLAQYNESAAGKMEKSINDIKLAIASAFSPEIIKAFADGIAGLAEIVGGLAGGLKNAAGVISRTLSGPSEQDRIDAVQEDRLAERRAELIRSGRAGDEWKKRGSNEVDLSMYGQRYMLDDESLDIANMVIGREEAAREAVFAARNASRSGGAVGGFGDVFGAARTVIGGTDATKSNVTAAFQAATASAAATPADKLDPSLVGAAQVFRTQADAARQLAQHIAAEMRKLKIEIALDGIMVGKGIANSGKDRK